MKQNTKEIIIVISVIIFIIGFIVMMMKSCVDVDTLETNRETACLPYQYISNFRDINNNKNYIICRDDAEGFTYKEELK